MAETMIRQYPIRGHKWTYEWGVMLKGVEQLWLRTGDQRYFDYIKRNVDEFVQPDGSIRTYRVKTYNIDMIHSGKLLFGLWRTTGDARYERAARLLRDQLRVHPRTSEGGFWHKLEYPHQMWLDGIYMGSPFYAEFAKTFGGAEAADIFDDVARQVTLIARHTRDPQTGLLYHGWDETRQQQWADPATGSSPHFWGRAIGWFMMALPDILEHFPADHPQRASLITILQDTVDALARVQDSATGLWYQVLDQGDREGNYLEASASCMFAYAIAKAVRLGYLNPGTRPIAERAFQGVVQHLVNVDEQGLVELHHICYVAGLGGIPYRDGSYECYVNELQVTNDDKGTGPFILASVELEM
ncbi:MAG: glycoside hydrolase family 88 protein [Anaerolineae bacterium]|nr:glycoside hydrolase family 88 protein [Anaerolineae bacterium]